MIKTSNISRSFGLSLAALGIMLAAGYLTGADAQTKSSRDPFQKPGYARPKVTTGQTPRVGKDGKPIMDDWSVPSIESRIEYYKRMRSAAAASGASIPKVTSVLTLNEMAVTGIFRTPRGYAAMVEAVPIKLSYTIYPGEKFFDGQLVAVEENQLIFRKVTKSGKDKFVSSVENKPLRKFEQQGLDATSAEMQTMAPSQPAARTTTLPTVKIVSPVDEMNNQPAAPSNQNTKPVKKPAKVARIN